MRYIIIVVVSLALCLFANNSLAQDKWYSKTSASTAQKKWYTDIILKQKKTKITHKKSVGKSVHPTKTDKINTPEPKVVNTSASEDDVILEATPVSTHTEPQLISDEPVPSDSQEIVENIPEVPEKRHITQFNNISSGSSPKSMRITQVEYLPNSTLVYIEYKVPEDIDSVIGNIWYVNFSDATYIKTKGSNKHYNLASSLGMPISSEAEYRAALFETKGYIHHFVLEFENIPEGEAFDIIEKEGDANACNFYDVNVHTDFDEPFIPISEYTANFPFKEYGRYIENDKSIFYIQTNGLVLTLQASKLKRYGKYYSINMDLKNYSGKSVLFSLDNLRATGYKIKRKKTNNTVEEIVMNVLSASDYDRRIKRTQTWNNIFMGIGQGLAAASAGYSSSTTTYKGNSSTYASASVYGPRGSVHGYGTSYTTSHGVSHTTTYNGEAAYWASQQAAANSAAYAAGQETIRESLNEGYVKNNTIKNLVDFSGYFNVKYEKVDRLKLEFKINGTSFPFVL